MNLLRTQTSGEAKPSSGSSTTQVYTRRQVAAYTLAAVASIGSVNAYAESAAIEVTHHHVKMNYLERAMRVVQITDLHRSQFVPERFVERVVQLSNSYNPDLVLLTGDFVTRTTGYAESCLRQLKALKSPLGLYAVLGNHDYWCDGGNGGPVITEALEDIGVEVVVNRSVKLRNGVRLVGVDDVRAGIPNYNLSLAHVKPGEPVLAMTHNPGAFHVLCQHDFITVAGHTHGGQIYVPMFSDALIHSPFLRGWYQYPQYPGRLYVSRGLGTIHVPMRLSSTPELTVFDVSPTV